MLPPSRALVGVPALEEFWLVGCKSKPICISTVQEVRQV